MFVEGRKQRERFGKNFWINTKVQWFGKAGMCLSGVLPRFYYELSKQSPPDILVVHASGNDHWLMSPQQLVFLMKKDLQQLHAEFPSMQIVFSSISERRVWRTGKPVKINNDRKSVNKFMKKNVKGLRGEFIELPLLKFYDKNIFLPDGVYLTKAGNQAFLTSIHNMLQKILQKSSSGQRVWPPRNSADWPPALDPWDILNCVYNCDWKCDCGLYLCQSCQINVNVEKL